MSQMPVKTFFPDFVPNQILTNTQLNDLREYLDDQNRLTRVRLTGTGIVCGLHAICDETGANPVIRISEGFGITSDGYLIEIPAMELVAKCSPHDPTLVKTGPYLDPDRGKYTLKNDPCDEDEIGLDVYGPNYAPWRLQKDAININVPSGLPDDPPNNPVTQMEITALFTQEEVDEHNDPAFFQPIDCQDHVLVLYLEIQKQGLKSCLTTDCNNKGQNLNFVVKPLLIHQDKLTPVEPCKDWLNPAFLPRFHRAVKQNGLAGLEAITQKDEINWAYGKIVLEVKDPLFQKIKATYGNVNPFLHLNIDETALDLAWDNAIPVGANAVDFNQYHYDFLKDVVCAYNEFTAHYCKIIDVCCPELDFPRHLMIRNFEDDPAPYRNEFSPSPVRNVMHHNLKKAEVLFLRIVELIQSFDLTLADGIKITPSQNDRRTLGEKAIPHYYDLANSALKNVWQGEPCCRDPRLLSYSDNTMQADANDNDFDVSEYLAAPLETLIDKHGFFRIEGHLGQNCNTVLDEIEKLSGDFNLDFNVKLLHLNSAGNRQISEAPEITSIKNHLITIDKMRLQIEELLLNGQIDSEKVKNLRKEMSATWGLVTTNHEDWVNKRLSNRRHCDLTFIRSDYLNIRSRALCTYAKIKKMLGALPDLDIDRGEKGIEGMVFLNSVSSRKATYDARATELKANLADKDLTINKRKAFELELVKVNEERTSLARVETSLKIGTNIAATLKNRRLATNTNLASRAFTPLENADYADLILQGLILGIYNLKEEVTELCEQLPKDVKRFNYCLFIYHYKNLITSIIQLKLLAGSLLDLLTLRMGALQPVWRVLQVTAFQYISGRLAEITDYINCINQLQYNCFHAEFSTNYYTLEHLLQGNKITFSDFATTHKGMEHLAGVERGNTFLLVCDEVNGQPKIVADFTLSTSPDCCCDFDPSELCLPPVALPDYKVIRIELNRDGVDSLIDVQSNDFDLNGDDTIKLILPNTKSSLAERNGEQDNLSIETDENGKQRVRYTRKTAVPALDSFPYRLENQDCGLVDESEVLVLIRPASIAPNVAQEDIVATSENQPIDIDITKNDFIPDSNYTLSPETAINTELGGSAILATANIDGTDKQIFKYKPPTGVIGTDRFIYRIKSNGYEASGLVTILIVPCCKEDNSSVGPIVTGPVVTGIITLEGEPAIGANILIKGTATGTVTDFDGNFSLDLGNSPGNRTIEVSYTGFITKSVEVEVQPNAPSAHLKIELLEKVRFIGFLSGKDLAQFTTAVFTGEDLNVIDPNKVVIETFETRHGERITTLDKWRENEIIGTTQAYLKAETFLQKTMTDASKSPEEIANAYQEVTNELIDAHKLSVGENQEAYKVLLETTTHAFMDKIIIKNPNKTNPEMKIALENATQKIKDRGISIIGFKNRFGGRKLKQALKIGVIRDLNKILQ